MFRQSPLVEDRLVLGDPFFRDTLLHSSLLHHLDHMAFTSRIDRIELFDGCEPAQTGQRLCVARLLWSQGKDAEYELAAVSEEGRVLERWSGYSTKALASTGAWPALADLYRHAERRLSTNAELSERVTSAAASARRGSALGRPRMHQGFLRARDRCTS